jgi:hypothetical protein
VNETDLFPERPGAPLESPDVTYTFDIVPRDILFVHNTMATAWIDGQAEVRRGEVLVSPPNMKQSTSTREDRRWCYRLLVVARTNTQVQIVVQMLPLDIAVVESSPWFDSPQIGGLIVHRSQAAWHPQLPPSCSHAGPVPYLVDRRGPAAKEAGTLPASQMFRDLAARLLMLAMCPAAISVDQISTDTLSTRRDPVMGVFMSHVETEPSQGSSRKRARLADALPPPASKSPV